MKNIVFTGGGSAGHIMPNLALIEQLNDYNIYYLGANGIEKEIISKYSNIQFIEIPAVKLIRSFSLKNFLIPFKLIKSINIAKEKLKNIQPNIIFSKGGFVSIPVCLAGSKLNIPIITHESDLSVGLANKIISKKAKYLCCSFEETSKSFKKNSIFTGSPVRNNITQGNKNIVIERHKLKNKATITIVGGSLGAKAINEIIWDNINQLIKDYNIIHIVGKNKINNTIKCKDYIQLEFVKDIENYFAASDLVISRAGSNTIFELLAIQKPMILIPLPKSSSRGDQILNAENFKKHNYADVILQENLNYKILNKKIKDTLKNKDLYIQSMKNCKFNNGNNKIISIIKETIA